MKKYFLKSKGQILKTSFVLTCSILLSIFLMTPLESLNASNLKEPALENMDCTSGWKPQREFCSSCLLGVCTKYREDRKYIFCGGMEIATNEYRNVFIGLSSPSNCN